MASIQRIKSPITGRISYRVQARTVGRPSQSATFRDRAQAKQWAQYAEARIRRERYAALTPFVQVVERYRKEVLPDFDEPARRSREMHLAWWARRFGDLGFAAITQVEIAKARDALALERPVSGNIGPRRRERKSYPSRHTRSPATVNRYLSSLSHLFTVAMHEWNLVDRHPVREVTRQTEPLGRSRFLTDHERRRLFYQCRRSGWPQLYFLVLLAITTGARRSELINLRWSDVSLSAQKPAIHVRESKNGDARFLPLIGRSLAVVQALQRRRHPLEDDYLFPAPNGRKGPYRAFDKHWHQALDAAGIDNFRFHDLRHTCASYLAGDGATLLEIADVLGHRSLRVTLRYVHLGTGHKRMCLERMVQGRGL
jgi:integrase